MATSKKRRKRGFAANLTRIWEHFDPAELDRICTMHETEFAEPFGLEKFVTAAKRGPENYYYYKDNGSKILAVAHLDTVAADDTRKCHFMEMADGLVVYSRALDDRLGAYTILSLLPLLGINVDILLTVGEESCDSTANYFECPEGKEYNWIIEFDRGGTDVVMYQYDDDATAKLVESSGAKVGHGSYSDIACLEDLGVKAFNWGIGYRDYHGPRAHAYLDDTFMMISRFMKFHSLYADTHLEHRTAPLWSGGYGRRSSYSGGYPGWSYSGYHGFNDEDDFAGVIVSKTDKTGDPATDEKDALDAIDAMLVDEGFEPTDPDYQDLRAYFAEQERMSALNREQEEALEVSRQIANAPISALDMPFLQPQRDTQDDQWIDIGPGRPADWVKKVSM